jgi:hypothetical protein
VVNIGIVWNPIYRVPSPANDDVCDYPLARNLVMLTVAVACEVIRKMGLKPRPSRATLLLYAFSLP